MPQINIKDIYAEFPDIVFDAWFLWLPALLLFFFWRLWKYYVRLSFLSSLDWVMLEIKLPREIYKSPQAMESVMNVFYHAKNPNLKEKYWDGFVRQWFSLEILGDGGEIRFFIRTQKFFKRMVEQQIYSHYPEVEVAEEDDYVKEFFDKGLDKEWKTYGTEFKLVAPDPFPIKTYVDYGLHDLATKEEQKIDPMTSFLEFLGSLKKGEQIWYQILIRTTTTEWKDSGKELVDKLMKREKRPKEGEVDFSSFSVSPGERKIAEAIEKNVSKYGFDVGMRTIYLARPDLFDKINVASMIGSMNQYNSMNLNGFKPTRVTDGNYFLVEKRVTAKKKKMLDAYRKRSYFYLPYIYPTFVLNTEELATIFHLPGSVAKTPTLRRIEAKKGEPPPGLPV
ncbi:MAG: hypothetical protein COV02_00510 [Candidatus Terrybacteria bacterium CG10_big_fil_rev_8_21_14_0_10_41_10]|uniref:DUF8128 domain-containing protein n=1 Tax=Candidatus Terrybacteria bacterium CG10_big_fil_rev_8_21_14_0_10_41_10 TaxID=1975026 RepID=A0A2M8LB51_9BACT|nr:MAG: hypothetical protein COV02_00510 [Candidatus Terrybacteria bacterium CG10_big_fil_rev_8_21_14_0_10_41_10]